MPKISLEQILYPNEQHKVSTIRTIRLGLYFDHSREQLEFTLKMGALAFEDKAALRAELVRALDALLHSVSRETADTGGETP